MSSTRSSRYKDLLRRLLDAREQAGLTQGEVAAAFGRPQSFVSKCESGERRLDVLELQDLARLYGKPLGFFVGEDDAGAGASLSAERRAGGRYGRTRPQSARRKPTKPRGD